MPETQVWSLGVVGVAGRGWGRSEVWDMFEFEVGAKKKRFILVSVSLP